MRLPELSVLIPSLVLFIAGCSGTADGPPTKTPALEPAVSDLPASGICAGPLNANIVTIEIGPDVPSPRCIKVTGEQSLRVVNATDADVDVRWGDWIITLAPHGDGSFDTAFRSYLAVGVHRLAISSLTGGAEIWLIEDR